jgi:preprotein translocase subunit SecA
LAESLLQGDRLDFEQVITASRESQVEAEERLNAGMQMIAQLFGEGDDTRGASLTSGKSGKLEQFTQWMQEKLSWNGTTESLARLNRQQIEYRLQQAVDDRYHPEIRGSERDIVLRILDETWMSHLLAMDHLRSAVSFRGMGQMDPKVEYKREGMKLFEQMWLSVGERVTDVIFRAAATTVTPLPSQAPRQMSERHDSAESTSDMARDVTQAASLNGSAESIESSSSDSSQEKLQPIRRSSDRVGRNDPCPCGSGKKYKNCHLRNG